MKIPFYSLFIIRLNSFKINKINYSEYAESNFLNGKSSIYFGNVYSAFAVAFCRLRVLSNATVATANQRRS